MFGQSIRKSIFIALTFVISTHVFANSNIAAQNTGKTQTDTKRQFASHLKPHSSLPNVKPDERFSIVL